MGAHFSESPKQTEIDSSAPEKNLRTYSRRPFLSEEGVERVVHSLITPLFRSGVLCKILENRAVSMAWIKRLLVILALIASASGELMSDIGFLRNDRNDK